MVSIPLGRRMARILKPSKGKNSDISTGFLLSVVLHCVIFAVAGFSLIKQPQFGVDKGVGGVEVDLVARSEPVAPQEIVVPAPPPVVKQDPSPLKTTGKDQVTAKSTGGAITEAQSDYLKNPAPAYPEAARRRGYEGTVVLTARIDKTGFVLLVGIEQSSGHSLLDEAALKAVKRWQFCPGMLGNIPVESTVRVPVKFDLKDAR